MNIAQPRYTKLSRYPILVVGVSSVAFMFAKTGRDTVFFSQGGLAQLPAAYILIAMASLPAGMVHLAAIKRWGNRRTRVFVLGLVALTLMALSPFSIPGHETMVMLLFVITPILFGAVFAGGWLLAGDLMEGAERKLTRKAYARLGAGSLFGGVLGGALAGGLSNWVGPQILVGLASLFLMLSAWITALAHRQKPVHRAKPRAAGTHRADHGNGSSERPASNWELIGQPYVLGLIGVSSISALAALFIDFQFYAAVISSGRTTAEFFGVFYAGIHLLAFFFQLLVSPWLQSRIGVGRALTILPMVLLGGVGLAFSTASLSSRFLLKLAESGVKASIHRSIWEQVFLPIARVRRDITKMLVDGLFTRLSEGLGAAVLYVWFMGSEFAGESMQLTWIFGTAAILIAVWLSLVVYLNRQGCAEIEESDPQLRLPDS